MKKNNFTYEKSGVSIKTADKFVKYISKISSRNLKRSNKFQNIGSFGSVTNLPKDIKRPKIVSSTDGVGTKIEIANLLNKFDTIGIDLVAMCVNDLIVQGAKPILFLDYISTNKIEIKKLKLIIKGIVKGCSIADCDLVGGETAEMPETYEKGKFDIAGFSVGIVDEKKLLTKNKIKKGNLILAIPSNGVHSNGYSLIRYILNKNKIFLKKNKFLKKEILKPTKIYVNEILKLVKKNLINGCANITGGGLKDNLERIIPNKLTANLFMNEVKVKPIFKWIKKNGVSESEMIKTFNCGVGFCIIIKSKNLRKVKKIFSKEFKPYVIGYIVKGKRKVNINGSINWK